METTPHFALGCICSIVRQLAKGVLSLVNQIFMKFMQTVILLSHYLYFGVSELVLTKVVFSWLKFGHFRFVVLEEIRCN